MSDSSRSRWIAASCLILYFVVMFPLLDRLEQAVEFGSYYFEAGFVALVWVLFRPEWRVRFPTWAWAIADTAGMIACGFAVFRIAGKLSLPNPFDLHSRELLCFLLLIGPLTEELIFRGALWELFARLGSFSSAVVIVFTTLAFSFAHFFAWWSVPAELHRFVIYQAIYTLALGAYCGVRRAKSRSLAVPLLAHAFFNFGYYLGFLS